ncbi:MAG: HNH endonuclease [Gallionella sp.]|nr:HNH endonuclease [Gallionella sp.]
MAKKSGWPTTSRHERGYGNAWDRLRLQILRRDNGLCQCSQCQGGKLRVTMASEVHHIKIKADGGTDSMDNLQAVAHACHERLTAAEQGREIKAKVAIGLDGYPIAQ